MGFSLFLNPSTNYIAAGCIFSFSFLDPPRFSLPGKIEREGRKKEENIRRRCPRFPQIGFGKRSSWKCTFRRGSVWERVWNRAKRKRNQELVILKLPVDAELLFCGKIFVKFGFKFEERRRACLTWVSLLPPRSKSPRICVTLNEKRKRRRRILIEGWLNKGRRRREQNFSLLPPFPDSAAVKKTPLALHLQRPPAQVSLLTVLECDSWRKKNHVSSICASFIAWVKSVLDAVSNICHIGKVQVTSCNVFFLKKNHLTRRYWVGDCAF